jgi:hypothetical protein
MATNLSSLIVHLGADTASFQSDLGRASVIAEREADKMKSALAGVAGALGVGISAGAFTHWISGAIDVQDEASKMAQKIGIATESIAGLTLAAQQSGVGQEKFQAGMVKLARSASDATMGLKTQAIAFDAIGVSVKDASGHLKGTELLLGEVADKMASYEDSAQKTAIATQLFGRAGAELIPLLNGGSDALERYKKMADDFGLTIGGKVAKDSERFNDAIEQLGFVSKGVANQIATSLAPALADLAEKAVKFFTSDRWKRWLDDVKSGAKAVADHIDDIIRALKLLGEIAVTVFEAKLLYYSARYIVNLSLMLAGTKSLIAAQAAWGATTAASFGDARKSIGLLGISLGVVGSAVVGWKIGEYLRDQFLEARLAGIAFVDGSLVAWERLKQGVAIIWEGIKAAGIGALNSLREGLATIVGKYADAAGKLPDFLGGEGMEAKFRSIAESIKPTTSAADGFREAVAKINADADKSVAGIHRLTGDMADYEIAAAAAAKQTDKTKEAAEALAQAPGLVDGEGAKKAAKEFAKLQDQIITGQQRIDDLGSSFVEFVDPMDATMAKFRDQIIDVGRAAEEQQAKIQALRDTGVAGSAEAADAAQVELQNSIAGAVQNAIAARNLNVEAIKRERDVTGRYIEDLADEAKLIGLSSTQQRIESTVLRALTEAKKANLAAGKELIKVDEARIRQQATLNEALRLAASVNQKSPFFEMIDQANELGDALKEGLAAGLDPALLKPLQDAMGKLNSQIKIDTIGSYKALLGAAQTFTKEGSSGFQKIEKAMAALSIIQDIIALKAAVTAVLSQGNAPPPMSFAAMAAMAAAVAPLLASIGLTLASFGGGGADTTAADRQAKQGTGTVLGDMDAKSESIANAVEITADATSELVGLNRGMLNALLALQDAIGGASNQIARGAASANFGSEPGVGLAPGFIIQIGYALDGGSGDWANLFHNDPELVDQGVQLLGGSIADILNGVVAIAYQEFETGHGLLGGIFSSPDHDTLTGDISEELNRQFQLIIGSIVDTVSAAAEALGIPLEDIENRIAQFEIEAQKISLKDLDADEQQKELEAVFGAIFDGLAGAVVPFIAQFQQVGEGLGETLVRIATEVQVAQEAFAQLGLAVDETDPERFAQIADSLIQTAGGLEEFIEGFTNFVDRFAPGAHQVEVQGTALASAFEQAGLTLPATAAGMWALMQSLDATTEAGQQQIATLIRLADAAGAYYDALEQLAASQVDYATLIAGLAAEGQGVSTVSPLAAARIEVEKWMQETILRANELARAAGLQGIAEQDLILIRKVAEGRILEAIAAIEDASRDLVSQIWGDASAAGDAADSASASVERFGDAMTSAAQAAQSAAQLLLGELSPLNDQQKLQYAIDAYQRGVVDKEDVLEIGRRLYGTASQYTDLFNLLQNLRGGIPDAAVGGFGRDAQDALDRADPAEEARSRNAAAQQLAQNIASLAFAQPGSSYADIAGNIGGFSLGDLAEQLGVSQQGLIDYLDILKAQESAVPDTIVEQTNRIVAAIYDVAGMNAPGAVAPGDAALLGPVDVATPGQPVLADYYAPPAEPRPLPVPPLRGGGSGGGGGEMPLQPKDLGRVETSLDAVAGLLQRILDSAQQGDTAIVAAVREVATTIGDGRDYAAATRPRNTR